MVKGVVKGPDWGWVTTEGSVHVVCLLPHPHVPNGRLATLV